MKVPMLDEDEYQKARELSQAAMHDKNTHATMASRFKPLLDYYKKLSGWEEINPNAILHHRIELYGPPCEQCGKPYRTRQASFCAACGHKRLSSEAVIGLK